MYRAVILTAIAKEYMAVRSHLANLLEETHQKGTIYEKGEFFEQGNCWSVLIVEVGEGNSGATLEAERAINHFNPEIVLFVGVAGGIKDVTLGDVVAATKVYGYESGKEESDFRPRPNVGESSYNMVQRARAESRKTDWLNRLEKYDINSPPSIFIKPIVAGEKVIASTQSNTFNFIKANYGDAVAIEMEGRGLLKATHANQQVSAMIIRGISDLIDEKSEADASGYQEVAAKNASAFAFQILSKLHPEVKTNKTNKQTSSRNSDNFNSSEIPQDVLENIKDNVAREYPNEFAAQKLFIDGEVKAWHNLQSCSSSGTPQDILETIKAKVAREYPNEFATQKLLIDGEVKAWHSLQSYNSSGIPQDILENIKGNVAREYPNEFATQKLLIDGEVQAWHNLHS